MEFMSTAELLGNLGEFAGAIGVILTLVYLSIQIRQNTKASKASTYSETTGGWTTYLQGQSTEDLELLINLGSEPDNLSAPEFFRAYYLCRIMFRRLEHDYYQYRADVFDRDTWNAYAAAFEVDTFNNPGIRAMWKLQRDFHAPDFATFLDGVATKAASQGLIRTRNTFRELLEQELQAPA